MSEGAANCSCQGRKTISLPCGLSSLNHIDLEIFVCKIIAQAFQCRSCINCGIPPLARHSFKILSLKVSSERWAVCFLILSTVFAPTNIKICNMSSRYGNVFISLSRTTWSMPASCKPFQAREPLPERRIPMQSGRKQEVASRKRRLALSCTKNSSLYIGLGADEENSWHLKLGRLKIATAVGLDLNGGPGAATPLMRVD